VFPSAALGLSAPFLSDVGHKRSEQGNVTGVPNRTGYGRTPSELFSLSMFCRAGPDTVIPGQASATINRATLTLVHPQRLANTKAAKSPAHTAFDTFAPWRTPNFRPGKSGAMSYGLYRSSPDKPPGADGLRECNIMTSVDHVGKQ
jgi:hypothetical protein